MPSKESRYADALAEDNYDKGRTDLPEGTDYAIVKGPTGTRIPIPRNGEDDESWHERIKNWQDRGVLVDWKGPAAEKMRTPAATVVAVEDAQPEGEQAFRQANKKLIDEREAKDIDSARGEGIQAQAKALKEKGIPFVYNDEGLFIPRGKDMTDEQWQAAKDAAAKKFTSISVWDGPDKEPDADADERMASGSGGSKFDQLRKAAASLFTNAVPEGASPAFQQGYTEGSSVGQGGAGGGGGTEGASGGGPGGAATDYDHRPADMSAATLEAGRGLGAIARATNPLAQVALQGVDISKVLAPDAVPPAMPQARPGISEEVPGVAAAAPPRAMGLGAPSPAQDHFGKELDAQGEKYDRAARKAAEIESAAQKRMVDVQLDAQKEALVQQAEMMDAQQRMVDREERATQAYQQTVADMQAPAAIDPDHYWKVRDTSQKVASVLAAFFSGGATLASMHAAINRDVAAQQSTAQNQMTFNKDKLAATYNTYLMGRQNGLDAIQAKAVATDVAYSNAEQLVKTIAMQSGSDTVKQKAEMALAEMGTARVKAQQSFEMATRAANAHDEANRIDRFKANLAAQRQASDIQAQKLQSAPGPQLSEIAKLESNNAIVKDLKQRFGEKNPVSRLWDKLMAYVPGSDADVYNRRARSAIYAIAPMYGSGVLSPKEIENWAETMIPSAGKLGGMAMLDALDENLRARAAHEREVLTGAGRYTTLPPGRQAAPSRGPEE